MKLFTSILVLLISIHANAQSKISAEDISLIIGTWEGSLTYLDYTTQKPFTMPANLVVEKGNDENSLVLRNIYPNEPKANSSDKLKVSKDGSLLNKHKVTLREKLANGDIHIQTEHTGKDDNEKALIRYTYILGATAFSISKHVQFEDTGEWIKRSEFSYTKRE